MWLRRSKSRARIHPPAKFACRSFKDIQTLLSDEETGHSFTPEPAPIIHRVRSSSSLLRTLSQKEFHLDHDETRIFGADQKVVVYSTSLRVVRPTFVDCKAVLSILRAFPISVEERDLSMDSGFMDELHRILGRSEKSELRLPRVFIGGRYVGGAEELRRMHESGELKSWLDGLPVVPPGTCEACGGFGFLLCVECDGSRKCYKEKGGFRSCCACNENGLVRCPSCSGEPLLDVSN